MNLRALKRLLFLSLVVKITTTQDIDDSVVAGGNKMIFNIAGIKKPVLPVCLPFGLAF